MSEINVNVIKNELATYGPNLVGHSTVTGDLHVTGTLNADIGVNIVGVTTLGVVTGATYYGDGSNLENLPSSAGLGTALSDDETSPLNVIYYTNSELAVGATITVDAPDSSKVAYTQYPQIVLNGDADLIVASGDDFIPDILGIGTTGVGSGTLTGDGGSVRADNLRNRAGTGAPNASHGLTVTGVCTATSFDGDVTGNATGLTGSPDITINTTFQPFVAATIAVTAVANTKYTIDTSVSAFTLTLPASPTVGQYVTLVDIKGSWATNNLTVARNGKNIQGAALDLICDVNYAHATLIYTADATTGWVVT